MLKLMIADDEEQVLNTLSILIDWNSMGLQLIGTCTNGIDAYHMIIDCCPDIVLTDIKMPGLTGLEVIEKIILADIDTEFVLLSGYGEFEYAQKAMQYGVRHYLLKPCNEKQIMEVMEQVKESCYKKRASFEEKNYLKQIMENYVIEHLFFECLSQHEQLKNAMSAYESVIDFYTLDYEVCYFHYLEERNLPRFLEKVRQCLKELYPDLSYYVFYVSYTLIVFFPSVDAAYRELDQAFLKNSERNGLEYHRNSYDSLEELLIVLIQKLIRYETVHFICNGNHHLIYNHEAMSLNIRSYIDRLIDANPEKRELVLEELETRISTIQDIELLKMLFSNMLLQLHSQLKVTASFTQIIPFIEQMNGCGSARELYAAISQRTKELLSEYNGQTREGQDCIERLIQYTKKHLADPELSLKRLSQNYLYMNTDYVGKQFQKRTGVKFSTYLANLRMEKAKELLKENGSEKIYIIAEQVGCENNPQYFSQLFKKYTGMTPTQYARQCRIE